jgi:fatty-acyl-CoA synthase
MLPNRVEAIETLCAVTQAGGTPVPVNTRFHTEEVERLLMEQDVDMVVVDEEHRDRLGRFPGRIIECGDEYENLLAGGADGPGKSAGARSGAPESKGIVIHTSGTTGHPKGAERELTQNGVLPTLAFLNRVPVRADEVIAVPAPVFHALGLAGAILPLALGGTLLLEERFDPFECLRLLVRHQVGGLVVVPVMLRRLCDAAESGDAGPLPGGLRWILCSGSALQPALERRARRLFGPTLRNLYGSTEAGWVSVATPSDCVRKPGTVGRPLPGIDLQVVGPEGVECAPGEVGEILVRSKAIFSGYTGDSSAHVDAAGAYKLGDLGWFDEDGYLFVADRADDMVVTGGENVYPAEVERVLHEDPGVDDAAVVGVEDREYGHVLAAFVVPAAGSGLSVEGVKASCRAHLANYKVPKHVWLVDALPYNASGKVLRRSLRTDAAERLSAALEAE